MISLLNELKKKYPIDERRIYASGFSMGGIKTWDLFQEYPQIFAALAPMGATFDVGLNVYGKPAPVQINTSVPVPVFYSGGVLSPLPELPFQGNGCVDRVKWTLEVNRVDRAYDVCFDEQAAWENPIWGINGDRVEKFYDASRDSVLTVHFFTSRDGVERTAFSSVDKQGHDCREHTCEQAWRFMSRFSR